MKCVTEGITAALSKTKRIGAVVLHWEEWYERIGGGAIMATRSLEHVSSRARYPLTKPIAGDAPAVPRAFKWKSLGTILGLDPTPNMLQTIEDQAFFKTDIVVDGKDFRRCTFDSCRLTYNHMTPFNVGNDCTFAKCDYILANFAKFALRFLKLAYDDPDTGLEGIGEMLKDLGNPHP